MNPLQKATPSPTPTVEGLMDRFGIGREEAAREVERLLASEWWKNDRYTVTVMRFPGLVHLSIRRNDRGPARDWRDFQAIKNQLVGPECEAAELYPAESRVVDTANQFHLWACPDPSFRFPFGFPEGERKSESIGGAVQRPFSGDQA